jgi:intracellular sulfur oxidation DsrE/DsrF family protein
MSLIKVIRSIVSICSRLEAVLRTSYTLKQHTDLLRVVVLVVGFAVLALHARLNLSANANTVTDFAAGNLLTYTDNSADNLVTYTERSG